MDIMALLSQAQVNDMDGMELGDVLGIHIVAGRMVLSINMTIFDDEDEDDPDDGEKEDIPEDDASKIQFPKIVAMGKKTGTDDG